MTSVSWILQGTLARLMAAGLSATIDISKPWLGLTSVRYLGHTVSPGICLRVMTQPVEPRTPEKVADSYVRGVDLVATYEPRPDRPLAPQIYWRVLSAEVPLPAAGLEMIVSLKTDLLDSNPRLETSTELPNDELWRLEDAEAERWTRVAFPDGGRNELTPATGTSLLLFRLAGVAISYAEMVHPTDYHSSVLHTARAPEETVLAHRLFDDRLEKGVIRRSRLRGLFVPRENDQLLALACYRNLVASAPPLTT